MDRVTVSGIRTFIWCKMISVDRVTAYAKSQGFKVIVGFDKKLTVTKNGVATVLSENVDEGLPRDTIDRINDLLPTNGEPIAP